MVPERINPTVQVDAIAASTDEIWYLPIAAPGKWRLEAAYFVSQTARTAHDTNYTDISLENAGTEIASEQTTTGDTGNLVAGTPVALALSGGSALEFDQGEAITIKKTDAGTGLALDGSFGFSLVRVDRNY